MDMALKKVSLVNSTEHSNFGRAELIKNFMKELEEFVILV